MHSNTALQMLNNDQLKKIRALKDSVNNYSGYFHQQRKAVVFCRYMYTTLLPTSAELIYPPPFISMPGGGQPASFTPSRHREDCAGSRSSQVHVWIFLFPVNTCNYQFHLRWQIVTPWIRVLKNSPYQISEEHSSCTVQSIVLHQFCFTQSIQNFPPIL